MTRICFALIPALLLAGCGKGSNSAPDINTDHALRSFLGVQSFTATYKLPPGEKHYLVSLMEFEDGELVRHQPISFSLPDGPPSPGGVF